MTKQILFIVTFICISLSLYSTPNPGDTTVVQCFTFDSIHTRKGWFEFPDGEQSWHKILMYYTLKCDAQTPWDSYQCGEWDYSTFTNIFEHTGILDSTEYSHPEFTANGEAPDEFFYSDIPVFQIYPRTEFFWQHTDTLSLNQTSIGNGIDNSNTPFMANQADAKYYYYWSAENLLTSGIAQGEISGMQFYFEDGNAIFQNCIISFANASDFPSTVFDIQQLDFTEVFARNIEISEAGWFLIDFNQYFEWNGISDIVISISYEKSYGNISIQGANTENTTGWISTDADYALDFNGPDYIEVPNSVFSETQNEMSIAFWQYGDSDLQPQSDMFLEASDENGQRKLCIHLPWSDGNVYWDAGNDGSGYDRIYKAAAFNEYAGKWNHWVFTKNSVSGVMKIYLNGSIWHSGTNKTKTMEGISRFVLGSSYTTDENRCYDGLIDDFFVFNIELNEEDVTALYQSGLDNGSENYSDILLNYSFDENSGMIAVDNGTSAANGQLIGMPEYLSYNGEQRFKGFNTTSFLPNVIFEQGEFVSVSDSIIIYDTVYFQKQQLITYQNIDDYTIETVDTSLYWPAVYLYSYNEEGLISDSIFISSGSFINSSLLYYSQAFEIINTIQVQNYVTPYGIGLNLGQDGFTWVYDVTEYGHLLKDSVEIQAHNTQELIDLKFLLIEGTPPRDILGFEQLWRGNYGHHAIAVDEALPPVKVSTNNNADKFVVRTRTTGHGMAGNGNCAEFCPTNHNLSIDNNQVYEWLNWKECADNPVYPQGGTWIFDRAGWCPGSFADTYNWDISGYVTPGDSVLIDYGMEQYPGTNGEGNYHVAVQFIQYGDFNFENEAAIHDIIAPSNRDFHNRFNPICNNPKIQIINNGENTLQSLEISYGILGGQTHSFTWAGELEFGEVEEIELPSLHYTEFENFSNIFEVNISSPNNVEDEYTYNNTMQSEFEIVDIYDVPIMFVVKTNNYGSQTYYQIYDSESNIMLDRDGLDNNTYYYDTLSFEPGCYEINFFDRDQGFIGQDGLNFWYWAGTQYDDGTGFAKIRQVGGVYLKHFQSDFGSFFNYQFVIADYNYSDHSKFVPEYINIYPNPAKSLINIQRYDNANLSAEIEICNLYGSKIIHKNFENGIEEMSIDVEELASGIYILKYTSGNTCIQKKWIKE
jgi:hypothetical protein